MFTWQYLIKALYVGTVAFLGGVLAVMQVPEAVGITAASWVAIGLATVLAVGGTLGLQAAPASVSTSIK
jgi:hypothetical protein